jgi:RimJ/RimL family protein N-acetyltransferase
MVDDRTTRLLEEAVHAEVTRHACVRPPWIEFADPHRFEGFWRMGAGEWHLMVWAHWWAKLGWTEAEKTAYFRRWGTPPIWLDWAASAIWSVDQEESDEQVEALVKKAEGQGLGRYSDWANAVGPPQRPTSDRLEFRRWSEDDIEAAMKLWGDQRVTALIDARGPLDRAKVEERLAKELDLERQHGIQYWPVYLRATGAFIGCAGLRPRGVSPDGFELGFHLCADFWGQGLATEAATAVIRFAFDELHASWLFAGHHPENEASRRVLEKLGFRLTHDELYPPTGLLHPSYRLTGDDFRAAQSP